MAYLVGSNSINGKDPCVVSHSNVRNQLQFLDIGRLTTTRQKGSVYSLRRAPLHIFNDEEVEQSP
jgi:hypothetical protein